MDMAACSVTSRMGSIVFVLFMFSLSESIFWLFSSCSSFRLRLCSFRANFSSAQRTLAIDMHQNLSESSSSKQCVDVESPNLNGNLK